MKKVVVCLGAILRKIQHSHCIDLISKMGRKSIKCTQYKCKLGSQSVNRVVLPGTKRRDDEEKYQTTP